MGCTQQVARSCGRRQQHRCAEQDRSFAAADGKVPYNVSLRKHGIVEISYCFVLLAGKRASMRFRAHGESSLSTRLSSLNKKIVPHVVSSCALRWTASGIVSFQTFLCVCVCVFVYLIVCMCVCIYIYVCVCVCTYICICIYIYGYCFISNIHMRVCVFVYLCVCVCVYI